MASGHSLSVPSSSVKLAPAGSMRTENTSAWQSCKIPKLDGSEAGLPPIVTLLASRPSEIAVAREQMQALQYPAAFAFFTAAWHTRGNGEENGYINEAFCRGAAGKSYRRRSLWGPTSLRSDQLR